MAENKTEQATPRRRQKAREKGQVVRSRDLIASLATMAATLILCAQLKSFPGAWRDLLRENLDVASAVDAGSIFSANRGLAVFRGIAITAGLTWLCASFAAVAQGGLIFAPSSLAPNLSRISPVSRFEQLFSLTSLSRLLKSLLPAAVVVYLAFSVLARDWQVLPTLLGRTVAGLSTFVIADVFEIAWKAALVLLLWSGADYLLERQKLDSQLRMSRQDLADEFKETEGQPAVKARIRRLQRQLRRRRMLEQVKKRHGSDHQPHRVCHRARVRSAAWRRPWCWPKAQPDRAPDQGAGALVGHSAGGKSASGACPLSRGGSGAIHPPQTLHRGGRHSGRNLPR